MKRVPLERKTPLVAKTGLRRSTPLQQSSVSMQPGARKNAPKRTRPAASPAPEVVEAVLERENYSCALCGMGIGPDGRGVSWSIHHRLRRSQGVDHSIQNLLLLDGSGTTGCHGRVHAEPAAAREGGWMLSGRQEPLAVPVLVAGQRWVFLGADGLYRDVRVGGAA